jgi:hypothetical protein
MMHVWVVKKLPLPKKTVQKKHHLSMQTKMTACMCVCACMTEKTTCVCVCVCVCITDITTCMCVCVLVCMTDKTACMCVCLFVYGRHDHDSPIRGLWRRREIETSLG